MPVSIDHLQRAQDNEEFFGHRLDIRAAVDRPWMVTALFYAALHWLDTYLGLKNIHPGSHVRRARHFATDPNLQPLYRHYEELYNRSRDARYLIVAFTEADFRVLYQQRFLPFRAAVLALLPQALASTVRPAPQTP